LEIVKKRLNPGTLIFDMDNRLSYANKEALDILETFQQKKTRYKQEQQIPQEIYDLYNQLKKNMTHAEKAGISCSIMENRSGSSFSLRVFFLGAGKNNSTHIMVLIERIAEKHEFDFEEAKGKYKLSKREVEVLRLLCSGDNNKGIAEKLFISEYTVKDHIKKIMEKMGVQSRNEIMALMK